MGTMVNCLFAWMVVLWPALGTYSSLQYNKSRFSLKTSVAKRLRIKDFVGDSG